MRTPAPIDASPAPPGAAERLLTSASLPVRHGFSVRGGGVSEGPFRSLNLSASVGDHPERVAENLRRLNEAAGGVGPIATARQVHGDHLLEVVEATAAFDVEADGLLTDVPGMAVGVRTADCVPILLVDPDGGRVAAVHSGWRGTALRIAAQAVSTLTARGARSSRLLAAIGPCIRPCCYEVSEELAARFASEFGARVVQRRPAPFLDLPGAVTETLRAAGVSAENIDDLGCCTCCDPTRFFSHRRDAGKTGRHLSFVVAPHPPA